MPYMAVTKNSEDFTLDFHPRAAGASNRAFLWSKPIPVSRCA